MLPTDAWMPKKPTLSSRIYPKLSASVQSWRCTSSHGYQYNGNRCCAERFSSFINRLGAGRPGAARPNAGTAESAWDDFGGSQQFYLRGTDL